MKWGCQLQGKKHLTFVEHKYMGVITGKKSPSKGFVSFVYVILNSGLNFLLSLIRKNLCGI